MCVCACVCVCARAPVHTSGLRADKRTRAQANVRACVHMGDVLFFTKESSSHLHTDSGYEVEQRIQRLQRVQFALHDRCVVTVALKPAHSHRQAHTAHRQSVMLHSVPQK
jgi:hypothetical protein